MLLVVELQKLTAPRPPRPLPAEPRATPARAGVGATDRRRADAVGAQCPWPHASPPSCSATAITSPRVIVAARRERRHTGQQQREPSRAQPQRPRTTSTSDKHSICGRSFFGSLPLSPFVPLPRSASPLTVVRQARRTNERRRMLSEMHAACGGRCRYQKERATSDCLERSDVPLMRCGLMDLCAEPRALASSSSWLVRHTKAATHDRIERMAAAHRRS